MVTFVGKGQNLILRGIERKQMNQGANWEILFQVTVKCKCGRRSENFPCLQGGERVAVAQAYQR